MGATPPLPLWTDDWLTSEAVDGLDAASERGYLRLLLWCWKGEGCSLPTDRDRLARYAKLTRARAKLELILELFFVSHPTLVDRLSNLKLLELWLENREFSETASRNGKMGAEARWRGHCAGNGKANATAMASPSPSPSPSSIESELKGKAKKERKPPVITETHKRLAAIWEHEQRETWGISVGAALTVKKHRDALDLVAKDRTPEEADAVIRAYVRLPAPFLRDAGHSLTLLPTNLAAAVAAVGNGSGIDPTWKIPPRLT